MATMKKTFVAYLRVSSKMQGRDGNGMQAQTEIVRDFVNRKVGEIIEEVYEVESGGKTDRERPELARALALCKKRSATLVVAKLDRLSRNASFLLSLQSANVDFVCCDCENVDRFTVGILALVAQRERELISERTKVALAAVKRRGVKLGTKTPERQVEIMVQASRKARTDFFDTIRPIIESIRETGCSTLQGISDCLNRRGIATRTGTGKWHPSTVRNVISREALVSS
jgi:DNA invertase Pin-like site-specific DNA recombinase